MFLSFSVKLPGPDAPAEQTADFDKKNPPQRAGSFLAQWEGFSTYLRNTPPECCCQSRAVTRLWSSFQIPP